MLQRNSKRKVVCGGGGGFHPIVIERHALTLSAPTMIGPLPMAVGIGRKGEGERSVSGEQQSLGLFVGCGRVH
jgi:hypothetical protein